MGDLYKERAELCQDVAAALAWDGVEERNEILKRGGEYIRGIRAAQRFSYGDEEDGEFRPYLADKEILYKAIGDEYFHPEFKAFMDRVGKNLPFDNLRDDDRTRTVRFFNIVESIYRT